VTDKLDEMWAALAAHEPEPSYAEAWATMLKERTQEAAWAAAEAAAEAADAAEDAAEAAWEAEAAASAQRAIDAIREVQP
jgi:hypothetical protein